MASTQHAHYMLHQQNWKNNTLQDLADLAPNVHIYGMVKVFTISAHSNGIIFCKDGEFSPIWETLSMYTMFTSVSECGKMADLTSSTIFTFKPV
jgi:hypothetical protein